jgi:hypothetical protein
LPQSPIVCLAISLTAGTPKGRPVDRSTFVVHQTPIHYRSGAIQRIAQSRGDPHYAGRLGSRGAP